MSSPATGRSGSSGGDFLTGDRSLRPYHQIYLTPFCFSLWLTINYLCEILDLRRPPSLLRATIFQNSCFASPGAAQTACGGNIRCNDKSKKRSQQRDMKKYTHAGHNLQPAFAISLRRSEITSLSLCFFRLSSKSFCTSCSFP